MADNWTTFPVCHNGLAVCYSVRDM